MYTTLISVSQLQTLQSQAASVMVIDCSCDLMQPAVGPQQFQDQHIAGALYADLNDNLSAKDATSAVNAGRHPLPQREVFVQWLQSIGLTNDMQVVVYDRNGLNYCGRLWWMLKWCGHDAVAVLDGGWQAWVAAGGATAPGTAPLRTPSNFALHAPLVTFVDTATVATRLDSPQQTLIDARGAPRYRGEVEPIDPVAGHIPGALNRPFNSNLNEHGFFKSPEVLRAEFATLLDGRAPQSVVHHCGSGVSAVPNVLAMEVAGLGKSGLYAGSWSEWCTTPGLPVAKG
jgi:thiosulfate/3-mercaptopyruvate sulfurtransferase